MREQCYSCVKLADIGSAGVQPCRSDCACIFMLRNSCVTSDLPVLWCGGGDVLVFFEGLINKNAFYYVGLHVSYVSVAFSCSCFPK